MLSLRRNKLVYVPTHNPSLFRSRDYRTTFTSPIRPRQILTTDITAFPARTEYEQVVKSVQMVKYSSSIVVPYARDRVWKLMSDWTNLAAWDVNIKKSELASTEAAGATGLGTRYDCAFSTGGSSMDVDYECIRFDAPNRAEFRGIATLFKSTDSIACEEVNEGTKITAEFNLAFRGVLSPLSFVMNSTMQKTGPIVMKDIEKFVGQQLGNGE